MASSVASGSQAATISTTHTLTTVSTAGEYVVGVDLNAMAVGDKLQIDLYTKMKSGSTSRIAASAYFVDIQVEKNWYAPRISATTELVVKLTQTAGTGRTFDWNVDKMDDLLDQVIEGTTTLKQAMRLHNSVLLGKASGMATSTGSFRDLADTKARVTATQDSDGNRTAVTLDAT